MKPSLGWLHIKDSHSRPSPRRGPRAQVEEAEQRHFVPADMGDAGHERILQDFAGGLPLLEQKLTKRGIPGVVLDLEPHLNGGGQFGGISGPDGMGVALRGLCRVLDRVGIDYHLRDLDDVRAARGF
jgi:hypothetical protein